MGDNLTFNGITNFGEAANSANNNPFPPSFPVAVNFGSGINTVKAGSGTLEIGGGLGNTGNAAGTFYMNDGTLVLNKQGTSSTLPVTLVIGDNDGGARATR